MKSLVERAIALRIDQQVQDVAQGAFKQVLLQDGTSFVVHKRLATVFPGRFKAISPAAIECHMLMSLLEQKPVCMQLSADTASERQFLPNAKELTGSLLLADAGYISHAYFAEVNNAGGFYLVRGCKSLNPEILSAWRDDGRTVPKLTGMLRIPVKLNSDSGICEHHFRKVCGQGFFEQKLSFEGRHLFDSPNKPAAKRSAAIVDPRRWNRTVHLASEYVH